MFPTLADPTSRSLDFPWLNGFDPLVRARLQANLLERAVSVGTVLLDQDQPSNQLWFVGEGSVAIERSKSDTRTETLAELAGPAIYGTTTFFRNSLPTMTIRAKTHLRGWTLDRPAYDQLRINDPELAEALALEIVQVLSERFDMLDRRITTLMADHHNDHRRVTEWADFRSRLFEEPAA